MSGRDSKVLTMLWRFTAGQRNALFGGLALLAVAALVEVGSVLIMADVLDGVLSSDSAASALRGAAAWVGVTLLGAVLTYFGSIATARASENTALAVRDHMFTRLLQRLPSRNSSLPAGDLVVRLTDDVVVLETAISVSVVQALIAVLTTAGLVGVSLWLSWQLTVIALIAVPVMMGLARVFAGPQERVTETERSAHSDLGGTVNEFVSTIEHATLHNQEARDASAVHQRGAALVGARMREAKVHALFGGVLGSAQTLTLIAVSLGGVLLVRGGSLSYGTLMALTGYLGYLYPRIQDIAESRLAMVGARISADRLEEAVGELDEPTSRPLALSEKPTGLPVIDVSNLLVRRSDSFTLRCDSFRAEPGSLTVITGPSGSGKSTLASVFAGMLTPHTGSVTVAGHDVHSTSGSVLRELVTLVAQPAVIRSGTLASNISYGIDHPAKGSSIARAGEMAAVDEFALHLPEGYGTTTTFGGEEFSGGQRQRIALARGFARATPIIILDEPSTGLDKANIDRLVQVLVELALRCTVIVVSHDPALAAAADHLYRVEDGVVAAISAPAGPARRLCRTGVPSS